ncbi:MAG: Y-family DNA polymerase [Chitinophagaceae bacterium]
MIAIVDCNSFYCSCERVFRPDLQQKPVVVLSNNDGCIIARSDEAKKLGVGMAGPFFLAKPLIEQHNVAVFSSNYNLYGDMSWRVMEILRMIAGKDKVEVYSVDEAFVNLDHLGDDQLHAIAKQMKETIEEWTGIAVSVGVAQTKVLAKVANRLSKKNKVASQGVMVLQDDGERMEALRRTMIEDIWGVGRKYAEKLKDLGIVTAYDLSKMSQGWAKSFMGGVVGERLIRELNGIRSIQMEDELVTKKMIATTRMFGSPVTALKDIKEAVATYTSRAAEKLRRQHGAAKMISVFIVPKEQSYETRFRHGPVISSSTTLQIATSHTNELIKPALQLAEDLYERGRLYKKAGVMLGDIVPDISVQGNLFVPETKNREGMLMDMMDNINFSQRDDILKFAASGMTRNWKMQQNFHSPRYTSRWDELFKVK